MKHLFPHCHFGKAKFRMKASHFKTKSFLMSCYLEALKVLGGHKVCVPSSQLSNDHTVRGIKGQKIKCGVDLVHTGRGIPQNRQWEKPTAEEEGDL